MQISGSLSHRLQVFRYRALEGNDHFQETCEPSFAFPWLFFLLPTRTNLVARLSPLLEGKIMETREPSLTNRSWQSSLYSMDQHTFHPWLVTLPVPNSQRHRGEGVTPFVVSLSDKPLTWCQMWFVDFYHGHLSSLCINLYLPWSHRIQTAEYYV